MDELCLMKVSNHLFHVIDITEMNLHRGNATPNIHIGGYEFRHNLTDTAGEIYTTDGYPVKT